jgi:hypothetical protein
VQNPITYAVVEDAAAPHTGFVVAERAVRQGQRPRVVDTAPFERGGVAADEAVVNGQPTGVVETTTEVWACRSEQRSRVDCG